MTALKSLVDETSNIKNELKTCHSNLKNNLIEKGVEIASNSKLLDLINKIGNINTWNFASGEATSTEKTERFYKLNGAQAGTSGITLFPASATGLSFAPDILVLISSSYTGTNNSNFPITVYIRDINGIGGCIFASTAYTDLASAGVCQAVKVDGNLAYITTEGFRVPVRGASHKYYWFAYKF